MICEGGPAVAVPVHVLVYNLGAFRSVAQGLTDQTGQAEISIGAGKYIVSAGTSEHDGWKSVRINAEEIKELSLDISKAPDFAIFNFAAQGDTFGAKTEGN